MLLENFDETREAVINPDYAHPRLPGFPETMVSVFSHHLFSKDMAFLVCCINYVLDSIISLASMASNVYVQDLSDNPDEVKATLSTGVSINHVITIFIALFGGWIWQAVGIETLFIISAVLGLCNSAYAASIKVKKPTGKETV